MSKVIRFPDGRFQREKAQEQAGAHLARLDEGATPEEQRQIEDWLAASPLHREVFLEMAALWDELESLNVLSDIYPLENYAPRVKRHHRGWWAAAACLAALLVTAWLLPRVEQPSPTPEVSFTEFRQLYATAIGEQDTVQLPDGSSVVLNTDSVIEVVYSESARNIFLTHGEGFFTVTPDANRPFRVYAGRRMVEAVGTAFTVQHTAPASVKVLVKEGHVNFVPVRQSFAARTLPSDIDALLDRQDNMPLQAGDFAAALSDDGSDPVERLQIAADELEVRLAWTRGMLLYQGNSLGEVLREFSRYTTIYLDADDAILSRPVVGYYEAGNIDLLLIALKNNFHIEAERITDNHIMLRAGNQDASL